MTPRIIKPSNNNRYYVNTTDGGLNGAKGNPKKKNPFLTSLPNCFSGDTKFITRDGVKTLKECLGENVVVLTEDGEWRNAEVKHFGRNRLIKLTFANGYVVYATPEHRWIIHRNNGHKKTVDRIERTTEQLKTTSDYRFPIIAKGISDSVKYDIDGVRHGFIYGDGSYYYNHNYTRAALCGFKKEYMREFFADKKSCENSNGVIECYPYPKEYKELPSFDNTDEYLTGFLIGLMAADGSAGKTGNYSISTVNLETAKYLINLCARLKIVTNGIHKSTRDKILGGKEYKDHTVYKVTIKKQSISPEMVLNPRHKEIVFATPTRNNNTIGLVSIEDTGVEDDVYCVVEPITHTFVLDGNILTGNCVAIYGWFNEIGEQGAKYLKKAWYPYAVIGEARREGLEITQEPTVGGIMVWTGGSTGDGHVCGCAKIIDKDTVLTSESEYYGLEWVNYKRHRGDGNWADGCYWMDRTFVYQGCIKNPFIEDEDMTKAETEALIRELVPQILDEIKKETEQKPADDWAVNAINMCIARDIMVGYPDGFHAQSYMRREEVAQVIANLTAKE